MKLNKFFACSLSVVLAGTAVISCRSIEEDGDIIVTTTGGGTTPTTTNNILSGRITSSMTLKAGNTYKLRGLVYIAGNSTLTIEPGTKIVGEADSKAALIITRGSKIMAEGTAANPIVFTSEKAVPKRGDWAGIVILGNAPTNSSFNNQQGVGEIEGGINNSTGDGLYGGTDANDNSGVLKYVRIEYAGYAYLPDKEINGLTFGGVGRGTTVDYVQVSYANDDSFEWFGGTVNCNHIISYKALDDDFDTDNGYSGKVQFGIIVRDPDVADVSGSNAFESDNDANGSALTPQTAAVFSNITAIGPINSTSSTTNAGSVNSLFQHALQIRRNSSISVFNSVFTGFPLAGLFIDATKGTPTDINITNNKLAFQNNIIAGCPVPLKYGASTGAPTGYSLATLQTWFNSNNNTTLTYSQDIKLANGWAPAGTTPNFSPASGSPLLTGAVFTNPLLAGFTSVTYRGAVKDGNDTWYAGWTNYSL